MVIGLGRVGPKIDGELGLDPQQIAPFHGPVVGQLVALEQTVDQCPPLVGSFVEQEFLGLGRGRQRADHVEIYAAHENGIGTQRRRFQPQFLQASENQFVDLAGGSQSGGTLERANGRGRGRSGANDGGQQDCGKRYGHRSIAPSGKTPLPRSRPAIRAGKRRQSRRSSATLPSVSRKRRERPCNPPAA